MKKYIDNIRKNYINEQKNLKPISTGIVTKDNEDGTYNIKINESEKSFYDVPTNSYEMRLNVGDGVMIGFEDNQKESPRIMGNSKNIAQTPKIEIVDFSGSPGGGGIQTETIIAYGITTIEDGSICKLNSDYDICHAAIAGDLVNNTDDFIGIGYFYDTIEGPGLVHAIYRGFIFFDTSEIPVRANITSAILYIYKWAAGSIIETEFDLVIQNGQPIYPHSVLVLGDYDRENYHNNGGSINTADISNAAYSPIPLNDNGKNWINKGGLTKFCLRSSREIALLSSGSQPYYEALAIYTFEKGEGYKPKLVITYTI